MKYNNIGLWEVIDNSYLISNVIYNKDKINTHNFKLKLYYYKLGNFMLSDFKCINCDGNAYDLFISANDKLTCNEVIIKNIIE